MKAPSPTPPEAADQFVEPSQAPRLLHVVSDVAGTSRLVDYMKHRLVLVPVTEIGDLITSGCVRLAVHADEVVGRTTDLVACGDRIAIDRRALDGLRATRRWNPPWEQPLEIRYEDDDLLVVEKPAGMHVHPLGDRREHTLVGALLHHAGAREDTPWGAWRPHVAHRLDCVVSGLLVVAKSAATKAALVRAQKHRGIARTYCAMVRGTVEGDAGVVDAPLAREPGHGYRRAVVAEAAGGRRARTEWRVLKRLSDRTLLELRPETGRTHQLRVHMAHLGHAIVGDDLYAPEQRDAVPARLGSAPGARVEAIALHAMRLRFAHPCSGASVNVHAVPPAAFGLDRPARTPRI